MEILENKNLVLKILVAFIAPVILYWQDLAIIANEAVNSDLSTHILALPFLLGYMFHRRKSFFRTSASYLPPVPRRRTTPIFREPVGILLCLLAFLLLWYGSYTFHPLEYHVISLLFFVTGIILLIFNAQTLRALVFPIAFLVFLLPPSVEFTQALGTALAAFSAQAAYTLSKPIVQTLDLRTDYGSPILYFTTRSGIRTSLTVDISCSGLHSLMGFILFAAFLAYISRGPTTKKIAMFAIGIPLVYSLNILRVTMLTLIGYFFEQELVNYLFHMFGGWALIFIGMLILLNVAEKILKLDILTRKNEDCDHSQVKTSEDQCLKCGKILRTQDPPLTITEAGKLLAILGISASLLFVQVPVFALSKEAAEIYIIKPTGETQIASILPTLENYNLSFAFRDNSFEELSGQDYNLWYRYKSKNSPNTIIWVSIEIAPTRAALHPWEVCLITWPQTHGQEPGVTKLDLRDIHLLENPPLPARYFAFKNKQSNITQTILYWYTRSTYKTEAGYEQKYTKTSLVEYTTNPEEYQTIERRLLPVAKSIANHWKPINEWSLATITIAENSPTLIQLTIVILLGFLNLEKYLSWKNKKSANTRYKRVTLKTDRNILDAVKSLEKKPSNQSQIAQKYRELSGGDIEPETLHEKLKQAEKLGLIERIITNKHDEPYIHWKPKF